MQSNSDRNVQAGVQFVSESLRHSDHFMSVSLSAFPTINKSNTVYTKMAEGQVSLTRKNGKQKSAAVI